MGENELEYMKKKALLSIKIGLSELRLWVLLNLLHLTQVIVNYHSYPVPQELESLIQGWVGGSEGQAMAQDEEASFTEFVQYQR